MILPNPHFLVSEYFLAFFQFGPQLHRRTVTLLYLVE